MESTIFWFKVVLGAGAPAPLLPRAGTSVLARKDQAKERKDDATAEEWTDTTPAGYDQDVIRWMPIVVPLFAVLLMLAVYAIDAAVLTG